MLIKAINIVSFGMLLVACMLMLAFIPAALNEFDREPEDFRLVLSWSAFFLGMAGLCFWNARVAVTSGRIRPVLLLLNATAVALFGFALATRAEDVALIFVGIAVAGPVVWLAGWAMRLRVQARHPH